MGQKSHSGEGCFGELMEKLSHFDTNLIKIQAFRKDLRDLKCNPASKVKNRQLKIILNCATESLKALWFCLCLPKVRGLHCEVLGAAECHNFESD